MEWVVAVVEGLVLEWVEVEGVVVERVAVVGACSGEGCGGKSFEG